MSGMTGKRLIVTASIVGAASAAAVFFLWQQLSVSSPDPEGEVMAASVARLAKMSDFEKAEYYFNHDDDPAGPYDLALARTYYEATIRASSTAYPEAWYQLGRIDFIEGKFNAALYKFDKVVTLFPDSGIEPHYMIGLTYGYKARKTGSEEDWEKAADAFLTFIAVAPEAPWPRVDLAWVYFAQGKYEEMKPVLADGLVLRPNNPWLHNMYGLALLNTGEYELAYEHFGFAKALAAELTTEDWGKSYPGNNPADWATGLEEFKAAIEKNLALAEQSMLPQE